MTATGYEPLNTLKPVADDLWLVDGPAVRVRGFPFPTRATIIRLQSGDLWVHSPTELTDALIAEIGALGPVAHIVAPNQSHFLQVPAWQAAFPGARYWAVAGVETRAARAGVDLPQGRPLQDVAPEGDWAGQIDQLILRGSHRHTEAVFFHRASETLILTDVIQAFETAKLPAYARPLAWLTGTDDTDGRMPPRIRWSYRDKTALSEDIETMIGWRPFRIILSHGRWYRRDGVAELERAFRRELRSRRWDAAITDMKSKQDAGRGDP